MTESQFTAKLLKRLREHELLSRAVIWKHCNQFTRGVPDFSITVSTRTHWYEVKKFGNAPTEIQNYYLNRIGPLAAFVITIHSDGKRALISPLEALGYLTVAELTEEIVARILR